MHRHSMSYSESEEKDSLMVENMNELKMRRLSHDEVAENCQSLVYGLSMAATDLSMTSSPNTIPRMFNSISASNLPELEIIDEARSQHFRRRSSVMRRTQRVVYKIMGLLTIHQFARGITAAAVLKVVLEETGDAAKLSFYYTILSSITAVLDVLFYPIRSHCADAFGRKPMLYVSLSGYTAGSLLITCYANLYTIFAATIVSSMFSILFTVIQSILGDILPAQPHILSQTMAKVGVVTAVAYMLGFGAGILYVYYEYYLFIVFLMQTIIELLAMLTVTCLPETVKKVKRDSKNMYIFNESISKESKAITESYLMQTSASDDHVQWNVFKSIKLFIRILRVDSRIKWLTFTGFMTSIGAAGGLGALGAYAVEQFDWNEVDLAIYLLIGGVCGAISSLCSGRLHLLLGSYALMKLSLGWSCIVATVAAFSPNYKWFYAALFLSVPLGFQFELAKGAYIISITPSMFQARVNTAANIMGSIATAIFTNLYSLVFWYFTSDDAFIYFPGAALFLGVIFRSLAFPFLLKVPKKHKPEDAKSNIDSVVNEEVMHPSALLKE